MSTVLVANRGEIAMRIIRTAKKMGLSTVAVYSDADAGAMHTHYADRAVYLGPSDPKLSYLNILAVLDAAICSGADIIHPGYGFLSENAEFAAKVEDSGLIFVGPTVRQLQDFGDKNSARQLAFNANVPMVAGTGLLRSCNEALTAADKLGYPVMLKATGGGGGIGMQACDDSDQLKSIYDSVVRLAQANFSSAGVFLERRIYPARHIEVQIFGDGRGNIAILGDRDCSMQRRNQKVVEEAPAPSIPDTIRRLIHDCSHRLASSVAYRSVGTVEFIYNPSRGEVSFLEVNTRLQVEHPVTEEVFGIDLVEQMLKLALDGPDAVAPMFSHSFFPQGCAIEARVYAEDPVKNGRPSPGCITEVQFPSGPGVRVDSAVVKGSEISPFYDPMIAKIICRGSDRTQACQRLIQALSDTKIYGVVTNLGLLEQIAIDDHFRQIDHHTHSLSVISDSSSRIEVIKPGTLSTIQDLPGRLGYWNIGIPPSGPMDKRSFILANRAVGNLDGAPALECTMIGPQLQFSHDTLIALSGAATNATIDGIPVLFWEPIAISAGQKLDIGTVLDAGLRTYLAVRGGFDVPSYLGSASTFTLGKFGGHAGRALIAGDVLRWNKCTDAGIITSEKLKTDDSQINGDNITNLLIPHTIAVEDRPIFTHEWELGVLEGPQSAPEFLTREDSDQFYSHPYQVHFNVSRTGVRLMGPKPRWSREDGGEAGLHPSNVHDNPYAIGAIDFSGDTPIILGVDGPSLGGFICPAVIAEHEQWKIGQLRPGDTVRFIPVGESSARQLREKIFSIDLHSIGRDRDDGVIYVKTADESPSGVSVTYRRAGSNGILIDYGDPILDIGLRMRVHALEENINQNNLVGVYEKTPGIRSLLLTYDNNYWDSASLVAELSHRDDELVHIDDMSVSSRKVYLPLSWDDPTVQEAVMRYMSTVRSTAPWLPNNIEFIRRINGLVSVDDVYHSVFDAQYLVMGLGDVYLGAPVATPLDPRHRLVTTKYNPARTITPENAVGLGGSYLCVYGLEGPGGYQLIGRTVPIYSRYCTTGFFAHHPWALDFFDRISWYQVTPQELEELRREVAAGKEVMRIEQSEFSYREYRQFLAENAQSITEFQCKQLQAFETEKIQWKVSGEFDSPENDLVDIDTTLMPGDCGIYAPIMGGVWRIEVTPGQVVEPGQIVVILEAMKMETVITADCHGVISRINVMIGHQVAPGDMLIAITPRGITNDGE